MRIIDERQLDVQRRRHPHHGLEGEALGRHAGGGPGLADEALPRLPEAMTLLVQEGDERIGGARPWRNDATAERGQEAHHRAEP